MIQMFRKTIFVSKLFICLLLLGTVKLSGQDHPNLILTKKGVELMRSQLGKVPLFDASLERIKEEVDEEIASGIQVPIPKDYSGGYTHERHKKNFLIMQKAGVLFQILQDEKYAIYIRDMLMEYMEMYPDLPVHPKERSYARGKIFWQCLNDSNWLVYTSQAYDCIYDWLSKKERKQLETKLFQPFADFISEGNPQFFNRVHNHSTWGNVAVGMIALVMDNDNLLQRALYGIKNDNLVEGMKDNDGGFIKTAGQKAGFYANLDEPFSPDGYYTEGPYYQRYAMYPFLIFAQALHNKRPELKIFEYSDGVLLKAVDALLNLSDADGDFFPINDAQKGMSYYSRELVTAVDMAYRFGGMDPQLLDIAKKQNRVSISDAGLSVAQGIQENRTKPFEKKSLELSDGPDGNQGGIAILRKKGMELVFKYSAQGLSHGHYDKLSYSIYESGEEVVQDYGLARFVNIEQKGGGNYLKENKTWAKQTVAHNTLVVDGKSHFDGKYEIGSQHHSEKYFFDCSNEAVQVASAKERNAYPGTDIHRTMALLDVGASQPLIMDIIRVDSQTKHTYDFPFYYLGQIMKVNFDYSSPSELMPLGKKNGYQHLFVEAVSDSVPELLRFNWLNQNRFYTNTSINSSKNGQVILGRIGANDPKFNLRRDPTLIQRHKDTENMVYVSIIESHGTYDPVLELSENAYSKIENLEMVRNEAPYLAVKITLTQGKPVLFILSNLDNGEKTQHQLNIQGTHYEWVGPFTYIIK